MNTNDVLRKQIQDLKFQNAQLKNRLVKGWLMLPFITKEIHDDWKDSNMIELVEGKPMWSQDAVDFACLLSPKHELSELTGKNLNYKLINRIISVK